MLAGVRWKHVGTPGSLKPSCYSDEQGPVAQLGARFHGMEEVDGSNPSRSTNTLEILAAPDRGVVQNFAPAMAVTAFQ